jgi:hypothetical protein
MCTIGGVFLRRGEQGQARGTQLPLVSCRCVGDDVVVPHATLTIKDATRQPSLSTRLTSIGVPEAPSQYRSIGIDHKALPV